MPTSRLRVRTSIAFLLSLSTITSTQAEVNLDDNADSSAASLRLAEEVYVWGQQSGARSALNKTNPVSVITPADMAVINAVTIEDVVKYEPSLIVRRRFIGDSNGTLGIRGSNMFQTSRSMVFADGMPLHYFLQSRWNGAPRWTMVSASEIAQVEVVYGPFSAEYSGNAMGGVVLIETGIPQQQEVHVDISVFNQQFKDYGFDDSVSGYKGFASYGNKFGDASLYLSYNRLDSDSQPQSFRGAGIRSQSTDEDTVSGAISGLDARLHEDKQTGQLAPRELMFYGDTGVVKTQTDNYKIKLGYDFGRWDSLLNIAFEDRISDTSAANSYIKDLDGNSVWGGKNFVQDGKVFGFNSARLNESFLERQSVSYGLRLLGELNDSSNMAFSINRFDVLKDQKRSSKINRNDPNYDGTGQVAEYDNSGWTTAELKYVNAAWFTDGIETTLGLRHESYELNQKIYNSDDYINADKTSANSYFGGKTQINAAFIQAYWDINPYFDASLGLRYEQFKSADGYYSEDDGSTIGIVEAPSISDTKTSPKFTLAYFPTEQWQFRYSIAKAYRFPIVEELFRQYQAYNSINEANPELKPEDGLHHNFLIERGVDNGYIRVNLFQETINDAIESQSTTIVGGPNDGVSVSTFVPIDKTSAHGVEFIINQQGFWLDQLDLRFNMTYTKAQIKENQSNPEWEGNAYPRIPKWRSNLLLSYHLTEKWLLGGSVQYASDSYGRLSNTDVIDNVYGAQDAYTRIGLKGSYSISEHFTTSVGVDNLSNEIAYVAHPWPGRTFYLNFSYDL